MWAHPVLQLGKPGPGKQEGLAKVMLPSTLVSDILPASRKGLGKQMKKQNPRKNNAVSEEGRRMLEATGSHLT